MEQLKPSRRNFLSGLGWASVGLSALVSGCTFPAIPYRKAPTPEDASLWLSVRPEGVIEIVSPRSEMGQGIDTAIKQIVAEEMNVSLSQVSYLNPISDRQSAMKGTVGSESIMAFGPLIAKAAAALNDELNVRASREYGLKAGSFKIRNAFLISDKQEKFSLEPLLRPGIVLSPEKIDIAGSRSFRPGYKGRIVGTRVVQHDVVPIVSASRAVFADDITLPDMVYARLITPPTLNTIATDISDQALQETAGYLGLVQEEGLLAILAENRSVLDLADELLEVTWVEKEAVFPAIEALMDLSNTGENAGNEHILRDEAWEEAESYNIDVRLEVPMAAHASMEPRTAVANFKKEATPILQVWTGSQDISLTHQSLLKDFSLDDDDVVVHGMRIGGGFGGKVFSGIERDAARLSQIMGQPVKLQWRREDEFIRGYHRPPSVHHIRASLDASGQIDKWSHNFKSGHVIFSSAFMPSWVQDVTSVIADKGVARGAIPPYEISSKHVAFEDVRLPINTGPWRGLGATPNSWAIETAINILAIKNAHDPLDFRLSLLKKVEPRLYTVLNQVAELAGWRHYKRSDKCALGVACGIYKEMAYSATIAEVCRNEEGLVKVSKMWSVHDCGFVVNPDLVKAQVEGNLVWGVGMALHEQLSLDGNHLSATNFDDYDWPSFLDIPEMDIKLINQEAAPSGAGETAIVSATASITNAIHTLTGKPVLRLPFSQDEDNS
ncbi:MAG: molybdopterin cofactor-binding domain-containing protein [Sneathiella sp.]